jgi:31-O-methyltransferase
MTNFAEVIAAASTADWCWTVTGIVILRLIILLIQHVRAEVTPEKFKVKPGLHLWCSNRREYLTLYEEFFTSAGICHLKYGVHVRKGDTIMDVGANCGFFATALLDRFENLQMYCFEPVPFTYSLLKRNISNWLDEHKDKQSNVVTTEMGMSSKAGTIRFLEQPANTVGAADVNDEGQMAKLLGGAMFTKPIETARLLGQDRHKLGMWSDSFASMYQGALSVPVLGFVVAMTSHIWTVLISLCVHFISNHEVECKLTTVSQAIKDHSIERIDLLKVDVEGAEHLVLEGVNDTDWAKVQQAYIEVHDIDGRVKQLDSLLKHHGFKTTVVQDDLAVLKVLNIYSIYATRN